MFLNVSYTVSLDMLVAVGLYYVSLQENPLEKDLMLKLSILLQQEGHAFSERLFKEAQQKFKGLQYYQLISKLRDDLGKKYPQVATQNTLKLLFED